MAEIAVQNVPALTGIADLTLVAITDMLTTGDTFQNEGRVLLYVLNGGGSTANMVFDSTKQCDQGSDHNALLAVVAGDFAIIGPFPVGRFGTLVKVTSDFVTSLTVRPLRISV